MSKNLNNQVITQRQLRVGELVKKNIGEIFIMDEAKIPHLDTNDDYVVLESWLIEDGDFINKDVKI